jgi:hypothetical protein
VQPTSLKALSIGGLGFAQPIYIEPEAWLCGDLESSGEGRPYLKV